MSESVSPLVLRSSPVELADIAERMTEAFVACRDALLAGRPVVVVLDDSDLLGQGRVEDAALATALLGLVRSLALEGARDRWVVNAISVRDDEGELEQTYAWLGRVGSPTGQLVRLGTAHLGKVWP